jgi:hypothetical protein
VAKTMSPSAEIHSAHFGSHPGCELRTTTMRIGLSVGNSFGSRGASTPPTAEQGINRASKRGRRLIAQTLFKPTTKIQAYCVGSQSLARFALFNIKRDIAWTLASQGSPACGGR